jgi:hypothetical protein
MGCHLRDVGISLHVSINPIGSVTSSPPTVEALDPIVKTITNAQVLVAPVTLDAAVPPPTGAASATLSAVNAQLDNTNNSNVLLTESYAAVALSAAATTLTTVHANPGRPAIAPVEPLDRTHADRRMHANRGSDTPT